MTNLPENVTGMQDMIVHVSNNVGGNILGPALLFGIFIVVLIGLNYAWDSRRALAGASVVVCFVSIFFAIAGILNVTWVFGSFALLAGSLLLLRISY